MGIDRKNLVTRHNIELTAANQQAVITLGNGDFGFTADITGMQTFTRFHDPSSRSKDGGIPLNTPTMANWGWHSMPNPIGFTIEDATTIHDTFHGKAAYADKHELMSSFTGASSPEYEPGAWLHSNPQKIDLGRIGFKFLDPTGEDIESDISYLSSPRQTLNLWTGDLESHFHYNGSKFDVRTVASPSDSLVAFSVVTDAFVSRTAILELRLPYAHDGFNGTANWDSANKHASLIVEQAPGLTLIEHTLDDTTYFIELAHSGGQLSVTSTPHSFTITPNSHQIEITARFSSTLPKDKVPSFEEIQTAARRSWEEFWESGACIDFSKSSDPRAHELERRVVLSQYLTKVHNSGSLPPQETGFVMNSWHGKFHLEMHAWHAAHFAAWGRPELLEHSLDWYLEILASAKETARLQQLKGARWPKQTGPDGRESPNEIGVFLIWQQPHLIHLLELVRNSLPESEHESLNAKYWNAVSETADFMAAFPVEREGLLHLAPPLMPAQEFYTPETTADPTFELAYWWWGLEVAQQWSVRSTGARNQHWASVQDGLTIPLAVDGKYRAIASPEPLRRDDHPSLLMALGFVPQTPLIDPETMRNTLYDVWDSWQWDTAWGWDFPAISMCASRLGEFELAIDALLKDEEKNNFTEVGHNPQNPRVLPLYLPGNGSLLYAVAQLAPHLATGAVAGWDVLAEGFPLGLAGSSFDGDRPFRDGGFLDLAGQSKSAPLKPQGPLNADSAIAQWLADDAGGAALSELVISKGGNIQSLHAISNLTLRQMASLSPDSLTPTEMADLCRLVASENTGTGSR